MPNILRHLLAILVLPFVVVIVIPSWMLKVFSTFNKGWIEGIFSQWLAHLAGALIFLLGMVLFSWCVILFARIGHGTLAPWDPTRNLVAVGPYQYSRNPMISSVILMLLGEALFWQSWPLFFWAFLFAVINHSYFILFEEPGLDKRFGDDYRDYSAHVPRWIPRSKTWRR